MQNKMMDILDYYHLKIHQFEKHIIASIKKRTTEELYDKIEIWIDHVDRTWGKIRSIATDNELFHNRRTNQLFEDNDIEHYVEDSGIHSKLGVINRFHRTLRLYY